MARKMILDCDTGTDDAIAVMLAALHPDIELLACTTVNGNVTAAQGADNTLRVLELIGRPDVPVYEGAHRPIVRTDFSITRDLLNKNQHGVELPLPPTTLKARSARAAEFLVETYRQAREEIVLVAVGPLTNIATALILDPQFVERVPELVIMGGAFGAGNATPSAEFNIWADAEAAAAVFAAGFRKITLVTLDATRQALVDRDQCAALEALGTPAGMAAARLIRIRIDGNHPSNPGAERGAAAVHDAVCVNYLIDPAVVGTEHLYVAVETRGELTLGRTVMDVRRKHPGRENCHVALAADAGLFNRTLRETFAGARG
jgi:inosine-uridine nucleoside N-ribohydrolase